MGGKRLRSRDFKAKKEFSFFGGANIGGLGARAKYLKGWMGGGGGGGNKEMKPLSWGQLILTFDSSFLGQWQSKIARSV